MSAAYSIIPSKADRHHVADLYGLSAQYGSGKFASKAMAAKPIGAFADLDDATFVKPAKSVRAIASRSAMTG